MVHAVGALLSLTCCAAADLSGAAHVSVLGSLPAELGGIGDSLLGIYDRAEASNPWAVVESGELNGRQVYGNSFINMSTGTRSGPWYMWHIEAQELQVPEGKKITLPAFWTIGPKNELGGLGGRLRVASDALVPEDTPSGSWTVWHSNQSRWLPAPDVRIVAGGDAWLEHSLPPNATLDEWRKTVEESSAGECDLQTLRRCSPEETQFITTYGKIMSNMDEDELPEKMKGIFAALAKQPQTPQMTARVGILKRLQQHVVERRAEQADFFEKANRVAALAKTGGTQAEMEEAAGFKGEIDAMKFREAAVKEMENQKKAKGEEAKKAKPEEAAKSSSKESWEDLKEEAAKEAKKEEL